jgi:hypothetical protein
MTEPSDPTGADSRGETAPGPDVSNCDFEKTHTSGVRRSRGTWATAEGGQPTYTQAHTCNGHSPKKFWFK